MLTKTSLMVIFGALFIGVLYLASNMKEAYKVLPVKVSDEMQTTPFSDWREFVAQTGRFKVLLPVVPQYAKETVPIPNMENKKRRYEMYVAEEMNSSIFMVSLITYPSDVDTSDKEVLHDIVNEMMATNPKNRLKKVEDGLYKDKPALDFEIDNGQYEISGKTFAEDHTFYLLTYVASDDNYNRGEYEHFINSFELLDPKKAGEELKPETFPTRHDFQPAFTDKKP